MSLAVMAADGHLACQDWMWGTVSRMGVTPLCIHNTWLPRHPSVILPWEVTPAGHYRGTLVTAGEHPAASPVPKVAGP